MPSTLLGAQDLVLKVFVFLELPLKYRERQLPRKEIKNKIFFKSLIQKIKQDNLIENDLRWDN